ncbi:MAG: TIR domain-containing protein [Chloroflexi bacterium]|nr:MAG: TIR domain-containing protein [Chloroflexota bacterium]
MQGRKKRIFISFAIEDQRYRDFLVGQARNDNSPFDFVDMSVKEPWREQWKTNCRLKIKGCDGMIALISENTMSADGARWEMKCAREENIPILGVYISSTRKGSVPPELAGKKIIEWNWRDIDQFIRSL